MAKEVCEILGLSNVTKALIELDHQDKMNITGSKVGRDISKLRIINEPGLYALIFKSRKPEAKAFKRWITHTVIPEIRKTVGFLHATEDMTDEQTASRTPWAQYACQLHIHPIIDANGNPWWVHHSVVINIKGNSYRLRAKEVKDAVIDCQKLKSCGPLLATENGTLLNDR